MTTKKIFKIIVIVVFTIMAIILLLIAFFWGSVEWNSYSKKQEAIRYQKEVCDTIKVVDGNFPITLNGFSKEELQKIHFYLQREKLLVRDTIISIVPKDNDETQQVKLPFDKFNINEKLIVYVGKRYYELAGYSYTAGYNYGMFGPVGSCQCRASGFKTTNGKSAGSGYLIKKYGLLAYQLPPR